MIALAIDDKIVIDRTAEQLINAIDITDGASATGENATALGIDSDASGNNGVSVGAHSNAQGGSGIAVGHGATSQNNGSVAIGSAATGEDGGQAFGTSAEATGNMSVAVGMFANATAQYSIAEGFMANATATGAIQIGQGTNSTANTVKIKDTTILGTDGKIPFSALQGGEVVGLAVNSSNHLIVTYADGTTVDLGAIGGGGTSDYTQLTNKPKINGVELSGNKTSALLGLQSELMSGTNIKTVNGESLLGSGNIKTLGTLPVQAYSYDSAVDVVSDTSISSGWYILEQEISWGDVYLEAGEIVGIIHTDNTGDTGRIVTAYEDVEVDSGVAEHIMFVTEFELEDYYDKIAVDSLLAGKQNKLTFDSTPTTASTNPVTSAGIKAYVDTAVGDIDTALTGLVSGGGVV